MHQQCIYLDQCTIDTEEMAKQFQVSECTSTGIYTAIYIHAMYLLCIHCVFTMYLLYIRCVFTVYTLCIYHVLTVYTLCIYCVCNVYLPCIYSIHTVFAMYLLCNYVPCIYCVYLLCCINNMILYTYVFSQIKLRSIQSRHSLSLESSSIFQSIETFGWLNQISI